MKFINDNDICFLIVFDDIEIPTLIKVPEYTVSKQPSNQNKYQGNA